MTPSINHSIKCLRDESGIKSLNKKKILSNDE